ncbi:MAG TPA: thioredoxin family protein [Acidobacteriaceae bacterium]|nr:thioredoxin family protein [Acidobacteriaceae bacterium]
MTFLRRSGRLAAIFFLWFALHGVALAQLHEVGDGSAGPAKAAHVTAELVAGAPAIASGNSTYVALVLHLEEGWHVYWINAGDSGEAPSVEWKLPEGVTIGKMHFPVPKRLPLGPLMDYGYEGTAVFPFELHTKKDLQSANSVRSGQTLPVTHLGAHVRWLVCREVCVPGKAFLGINLPQSSGHDLTASTNLIAAALKEEPTSLPNNVSVHVAATRDHLILKVETGEREAGAEFYPLDEDAIRNAAEQKLEPSTKGIQLTVERGDISDTLPARLKGVVKLSGGRAYLVDQPVQAAAAAASKSATSSLGFTLAIVLALTGGLVLNLMPCVFPVLFLKALALAGSAGDDRQRQRLHGLSYTAGILVSFWAIVAVLLALRAGGRQAGWGFQLQSPAFVVLMASLLFFMALSLAGQFDLGLSLTSKGDALTRKSGFMGSFFTGVLATVVATPCTAPLMGAAIGFALAQSAIVTFAIFTALALGLALPYLLLTLQPSWAKLMPRPGRWMETMKQLTAVPLLLTVVWLVWVYGHLYSSGASDGSDHIARLLVGLVLIAVAGWALAHWPAQRVGMVAAVGLVAASLAVSLSTPRADRLQWQTFSAAAVEQAQAQGRPVFVDFTAAWCLSCQVNERAVLGDAAVERALGDRHFVLLRADWTRYDPEITRQLALLSRSGVPTYVIYPAQMHGRVQVLPELLTRPVMLRALSQPGT